jgi:hypothetical protein
MSNAPPDIGSERLEWLAVTGLAGNAIGIAADERHLLSGGYHAGALDLRHINAVGEDDYSIRQPRDRRQYMFDLEQAVNVASATDIGSPWPRGGRPAWIRFNMLLRLQLGKRDPLLSAVRGINYTEPDGSVRRYDVMTRLESSSTDRDHTHIEFWRDTIATTARAATLNRITEIMIAARDQTGVEDMDAEQASKLNDVHFALTSGPFGPEQVRWATGMGKLDLILSKLGVAQADIDDIQSRTGGLTLTDAQVAVLADRLQITPAALTAAAREAINARLDDDSST